MKKLLFALAMSVIFMACTKSNDPSSNTVVASGYRIYLKATAPPAKFTSLETSVLGDRKAVSGSFPTTNTVLYTKVDKYADILVGANAPDTGHYYILIEQNLQILKQYSITLPNSVFNFQNINPANGDIWIYISKN